MKRFATFTLAALALSATALQAAPGATDAIGEVYDPIDAYYSTYYGSDADAQPAAPEITVSEERDGEMYDPVDDYYSYFYGPSEPSEPAAATEETRVAAPAPWLKREASPIDLDAMADPAIYYNGDF